MNGIEDLPLFLIHTVSTSSIGIKESLLPCKIIRGAAPQQCGFHSEHPTCKCIHIPYIGRYIPDVYNDMCLSIIQFIFIYKRTGKSFIFIFPNIWVG